MRGKSLFLLLLALGCGLVASVGITQVMSGRDGSSAGVEMEKIVVAVKDLPMGDPVNLDLVKLEDWPRDKIPPGALTNLEELNKRRPKTRIFSGSPVLNAQLFGQGETENAAGSHIPPGYRVVSIQVDGVSSSGGLIRAGDRVDLLLCAHPNPSKGVLETSTRTILQDVKVFAVDGRYRLDSADLEKVEQAKTVALLLTPQQAQIVTLATEVGTMRLALRSPDDQLQPTVGPSGPSDLFGLLAGGSKRDKERESSLGNKKGTDTAEAGKPEKGDKVDDLLKFLNGAIQSSASAASPAQETKPAAPSALVDAPAPAPEIKKAFTMRVISGTEVSDVRLEMAGAGAETGVWRLTGAAMDFGALAAPVEKKPAGPPLPELKPVDPKGKPPAPKTKVL